MTSLFSSLLLLTVSAVSGLSAQTDSSSPEYFWLGAKISNPTKEEYIAYGTHASIGGVELVEVPAGSPAAQVGLQAKDLIQGINEKPVKTTDDLLKAYALAGTAPLQVTALRYKQEGYLPLNNVPTLTIRTVEYIPQPSATNAKVSSSGGTKNDPLSVLVDGKVAQSYGPIFPNNTTNNAYKLELPRSTSISRIESWSHNVNGSRGPQIVTIYGSNSKSDPGWNLTDRSKFTPIASVNTMGINSKLFTGATLKAQRGQSLGTYKWIIWKLSPLNQNGEYTAFQELSVK